MSFCATPEPALAAANNNCKWPSGHIIRWRIDQKLDEFTDEEYRDIATMSWAQWEAVCGVRLTYSEQDPNIVVLQRRIDGSGGVLAEAELPCGNVTRQSTLRTWFDSSEDWVNAQNPSGRMMDLLRVMIHEFGHLLGIGHITNAPAIMNPSVSQIRSLQPPDVREGTDRYGDPSTTPPPTGQTPCDMLLAHCFQEEDTRKSIIKGWEIIKRAIATI